jgi:hypothetical protein
VILRAFATSFLYVPIGLLFKFIYLRFTRRFMKRLFTTLSAIVFCTLFTSAIAFGQVTIVNYDFNAGTNYPTLTPALASGVTAAASSTQPFATVGGTVSGAGAFTTNATAGTAVTMADSSGTNTKYYQFDIGGVATYSKYKVYFQGQRSATGATTASVAYSSTGCAGAFTIFGTSQVVATAFATSSPTVFDLSAISALDNQANVCFRILAAGASGAGTFRIDNFQIQAQTPLDITTANSMPNGTVGVAYTTSFASTGGLGPYTYAGSGGAVPTGLTLNTNGTWSGTPSLAGTYNFEVTVTDSNPFALIGRAFANKLNPSSPNAANTKSELFQIIIGAAPTAANASVRGRVVSESGRGLSRASISVLDTQTGETRYARTNQLGYFTIADLPVGSFYVMQTQRKGYTFAENSFQLFEDLDGLTITGTSNQ